MPRINKNNYLKVLQDTMGAIGSIVQYLGEDKIKNRIEISTLNNAAKMIQNVLLLQKRKNTARTNNIYSQRIAEAENRKHTLREQARENPIQPKIVRSEDW